MILEIFIPKPKIKFQKGGCAWKNNRDSKKLFSK